MALLHRALLAWFVSLVFLILLVLQLDHRTNWSWFLVLTPLWFWDCVIIILLVLHFVSLGRQQHLVRQQPCFFLRKLTTHLSPVVLKVTFQILLCHKLDQGASSSTLPLYYIFIPFWLLLMVVTRHLTTRLDQQSTT